MDKETTILSYGDEEGHFYIHQMYRTKPFERTNHYHSTYEIYYQLFGQRSYFIRDRAYHIMAGDLIFVNKYDVHKASDLGPSGQERIVINFSETFLGTDHPLIHPSAFRIFHRKSPLLRLNAHEQTFVQGLLDKLSREVIKKEEGFETYVRLLLSELLLFAVRHTERNETADAEIPSPIHRKVTEVVKHINKQFHKRLQLTELAAAFAISPYYLSRTFKSVTGFTLIDYINLTRIKEAQRLLRETDDKIIDISEAAGFENVGHFDRVFKKFAHTSPLAFRKLHRS